MSEFKFACPVCGQHMMCDTAHGGAVMDCPTCFQKIIAPQAPGLDSKFILTGTKQTDKKPQTPNTAPVPQPAPAKKAPAALALLIILACAGIAALVVFVKRPDRHDTPPVATNRPPAAATNPQPSKWTLSPDLQTISNTVVSGRIHGQDFTAERAVFSNGSLVLRSGTQGPMDFGCVISFGGAQADALAGKKLHIIPDTNRSARISLRWKDETGVPQRQNFEDSYALRLEFGPLSNNILPGKIFLCTPDPEKSYLQGTFKAGVTRPRPKPGQQAR